MASGTSFVDRFDTLDRSFWSVSDFTQPESWIHNGWSPDNVVERNGKVRLVLDTDGIAGKPYTGGEIQTYERFGFGRYEAVMRVSAEPGVNTSFFTYTGPWFGDPWNEIDFEFLGKDPTKVHVAYHNGGRSSSAWLDLGFDASRRFHTYAFEWEPDGIRWYVDGKLIHAAEGPDVPVPTAPGKLYLSIWTGLPDWLGVPTFARKTSAVIDRVSFTPDAPDGDGSGDVVAPVPPARGRVVVTMHDGATDAPIGTIRDGTAFAAADLEEATVLLRPLDAMIAADLESVRFRLRGPTEATRVESHAPYALFGDDFGDLAGRPLAPGEYVLRVAGFDRDGGLGERLFAAKLQFSVVAAPDEAPSGRKARAAGSLDGFDRPSEGSRDGFPWLDRQDPPDPFAPAAGVPVWAGWPIDPIGGGQLAAVDLGLSII